MATINYKRAVVTGAGGFIGGHLVKRLLDEGYLVRAVDWKAQHEWYQIHPEAEILSCHDLRTLSDCLAACDGVDEVYNLAADMGGMGFIETHKLDCMISVLINTHMLQAAVAKGVRKYFYASSACVYPGYMQGRDDMSAEDTALHEDMAYPADPEDGYGWEKLFSERMCRHFAEDRGLEVRIARYHNVYGPHGTWEGGREKAPAAMCRKVAECVVSGNTEIEIWGNGEQQRSYMFIDDCIEGTRKLMESKYSGPLNIGSSEMVTVNELANAVEEQAGLDLGKLTYVYDLTAPQGVRGRNSDNTLIKQVLGWEPCISLATGLRKTYNWVYDQVLAAQSRNA